MSQLNSLMGKAADAFAGTGAHNLSFDIWRLKARQTVASVEGEDKLDLTDFDYWFKRNAIIEAVK